MLVGVLQEVAIPENRLVEISTFGHNLLINVVVVEVELLVVVIAK